MDVNELNLYAWEIFEWSKSVTVKTPEKCVEVEEKITEILGNLKDIEDRKSENKFSRIYNRLTCALNFATKAHNSYSRITKELETKQRELEEARAANTQKIKERMESKNGKIKVQSAVSQKEEAIEDAVIVQKKKPGRPRGS